MSELADIKAQLNRIELALIGDEPMGQTGLVDRMARAEIEIESIKQDRRDEANQKRGAVWLVGTVSAVAGAAGAVVTWVVSVMNGAPKP